MDDPNITMEEYIRLEEEKTRRRAIVFNDVLTSEVTLSCEPKVSPLNDNKIDFRISFDESDDEDYMTIYDKKSFSYKIIYVDDLKTDSENDNDKVNMPSFPKPTVSYYNDLDYFKDFEKEFTAIVYNDALTSKLDFLTEPTEENALFFNDLFPFNLIYPDDSKSDKDNDDDKIDIKQPSRDMSVIPLPNVINTNVGAYAQGIQYGVSLGLGHSVLTTCTDPAVKEIDDLVMIYFGKRRVLNSHGHSDASSTHFCSRTQIR
ncbi:hypothetical protein Tco_0272823 [Tanacetum coccineum]